MAPANLGDRIRAARKAAGLTQRDLAYQLGELDPALRSTDPNRVSTWETNKHTPAWHALVAIAKATGKPPVYFADGNGDEAIAKTIEAIERLTSIADSLERAGLVHEAASIRDIAASFSPLLGL